MGRITQIDKEKIEKINKLFYLPLQEKNEILQQRVVKEEDSRPREEYQRDYTRVLYSSAFRRLQGKMQLMAMNGTNFTRNRLTHSLEVAQIARSIAQDIGYSSNELYVVEACSLAHDIGNPPFGHYGEKVLNKIIKDKCDEDGLNYYNEIEGFEGNAQTLRVLRQLSGKSNKYKGLNLTYRVLLGVVKYFNTFSENNRKFIYKADYEDLKEFILHHQLPTRTLDVQIMDLSDEIAYAAHDIEDSLKNRKFTIDEFIEEFKCNTELQKRYSTEVNSAIDFIETDIIDEAKKRVHGNSVQYNDLFAKEVGSLIIYNLIRNIDVIEPSEGEKQLGFPGKFRIVSDGLKSITFGCINRENEVRYYELKGKIILEDLFEYFYKNTDFLPREFRELIVDAKDPKQKIRPVIDYISGMMDGYAISMHREIYGEDRFKVHGFVGVNSENK